MKQEKILIIDDDPVLLKLNKDILLTEGYQVTTASDGLEGLTLLENSIVDLVITDILMPGMDGYTFSRKVRANIKITDIPIIVYTATYTSEIDEALAIKAGASLYIRKPASSSVILDAVKKLLDRQEKNKQKNFIAGKK